MQKQAEGFETTEYGDDKEIDAFQVVNQIIGDKMQDEPNHNVRVSFDGKLLKITYHAYEMHAPTRMKQIEDAADQTLKSTVTFIKKEFKAKTKKTLALKEQKDRGGNSVQKVSMNERYYYIEWRAFEMTV